jgi:uncharacterized coiled-coil DUF342 family protein
MSQTAERIKELQDSYDRACSRINELKAKIDELEKERTRATMQHYDPKEFDRLSNDIKKIEDGELLSLQSEALALQRTIISLERENQARGSARA